MNLIDLLLDSPIYLTICENLEINDIIKIFISNKKIYENMNNKIYTKQIILQKGLTKIYHSFKGFSISSTELSKITERSKILNLINKKSK
jgi:hypothetical protein